MNNLTKNSTVTSSLTDADQLNPLRPGSYYDDYQITDLAIGETVVVNLDSENIDTELQLINAETGQLITRDGNKLSFTPQANISYIIRVTSEDSQDTGDYTLITEVFNLDIDLSVTEANISNAGKIGDIVEASWTVANQGTETTTSDYWLDRIYVSDDEKWSEDDTLATSIWTDDEGFVPVAGGESYTATKSLALPNTESGDRYLLFITDLGHHQEEADENNNTVAVPITLTAPDVDFVINETNVSTELTIGDTIEASWTVTNQGTEETTLSDGLYDAIYVSDDRFLDDSDTYVTEYWSGGEMPLTGGESYTATENFTFPNTKAGDRFLLFVVDDYNGQYETDKTNNIFAVPVTVSGPDVDLTLSDINVPTEFLLGDTVETSWTVANSGTDTAVNNWNDYLYLSDDENLDDSDLYVTNLWTGSDSLTPLNGGESYTTTRNITLSNTEVGNKYLLYVTDRWNQQYETDENNTVAIPISLTTPDVDLTINTDLESITADVGERILPSWTVTNQGTESTNISSWSDRVYLSEDDTFDDTDLAVGSYFTSENTGAIPLLPGENYTRNLFVDPPDADAGNYYLLVVADGYSQLAETNENNNTIAIPVTLTPPPEVDLTIDTSLESITAEPGDRLEVSWTVTNTGPQSTNSTNWVDRVYLSEDETYDSDDTFLTAYAAGEQTPLALDGSYTRTETIFLPDKTPDDYYLLLLADHDNLQAETNESNNAVAVPITLTQPPEVDLTISTDLESLTAAVGDRLNLNWTVTNNGKDSTTSQSLLDSVYLSQDETVDDTDIDLGGWFWSQEGGEVPLAPNQSYSKDLLSNFSIPETEPGEYFLLLETDADDRHAETDEDNNTVAVPITLTPPPEVDLTINTTTEPITAAAIDTVELNWTVVNQGSQTTNGHWVDRIYFSQDETIDSSDTYLGFHREPEPPTLSTNQSYTATSNITLPNTTSGDYYLLVHVDNNDQQGETNEENNTLAIPLTLTGEKPANLIITDVTAPNSGTIDENILISWTVANVGDLTAQSSGWYDRVYLSDDELFDDEDLLVQEHFRRNNTPLVGGEEYTFDSSIKLPVNQLGDRYLLFITDANDDQDEADETDNVYSLPIKIQAPNLEVTELTAPDSAAIGDSIIVSWTIANTEEASANQFWSDHIYLSDDEVFDESDIFLSSDIYASGSKGSYIPLAAGDSYTLTLDKHFDGFEQEVGSVIIPDSVETGEKFLLVVADNDNRQKETNEEDNTLAVPITIGASNLNVINAIAPDSVNTGETIELSWTIANNGSMATSNDWIDRVYISDDEILDASDENLTWVKRGENTSLDAGNNYTVNQSVQFPSTSAGDRYLLFVADDDQEQVESNENDNVYSLPIEVKVPNLTINNTETPESAILGNSVNLSWTVANNGTGIALSDWFDTVYLSDDPNIDYGSDRFLTKVDLAEQSPLESGADYTISQEINLPLEINPGERYLLFIADGKYPSHSFFTTRYNGNFQAEINEEDNILAVPIDLVAPELVDLTVTDISVSTEIISGQEVEVTWTVTNNGEDPITGTWSDSVYLSGDDTFGEDRQLGTFDFTGTIAAGESLERKQVVEIPIDISGEYWFAVETDVNDQKIEYFKENNNTLVDDQSVNIVLAEFPNLQVSSITAPTTAFSSQETVVKWTVTNNGDKATSAPYWYDKVWLSLDETLDETDVYLGQKQNSTYLRVGDNYINDLTVALPLGISGDYYFLVQADADNLVYEHQNEDDNLTASTTTDVELTPPPDLQVTQVQAPINAFTAQSISLTWTVENKGAGQTLESQWYDRIYLSEDETLDSDDLVLDEIFHRGILKAGESYTQTQDVTLPTEITGDYYVFVETDAREEVYEQAFDANNDSFDRTPTKINLTPPPDLELDLISILDTARAGTEFTINYQVGNFGSSITPNNFWTDSFYLSEDEEFDPEVDLKLGDRNHFGALETGEEYQETATFTLDDELEGNYYVFAVTDSEGEVFELDDENNRDRSLGQVEIVSNPADLVISATAPDTVEAGKAIRVEWTVTNQGSGDTINNFWRDRIIASTNSTLGDEDDLELAIVGTNAGILAPGESYTQSELVTIPFGVEGDYQLFVVADGDNLVYEAEAKDNNTVSLPLTVSRQTPDLQVTAISAPNTITSGQELALNWTVANIGTGKTNTNFWQERVYLSTNKTLSDDDLLLGWGTNPSSFLEASETYTQNKAYEIPLDVSGEYYVLVETDSKDSVIESSEDNNLTASEATITINPAPAPDLIVDNVIAPTTAISGQSLDLTWTVSNTGTADATGRWYDNLYLSRDRNFDPKNDIYLGLGGILGSGLATGESYTLDLSLDLPRGVSGDYFVLAVSDRQDRIYEGEGENNNTNSTAVPVEIILPPPADLVVTDIDTPADATVGKPIQISYTATNQGTESAFGTWQDSVYLSKDQQWDLDDVLVGKTTGGKFAFGTGSGGAIPLDSGDSYQGAIIENLSGITPGDYYVLVRSDIRNQAPENDENNNLGVSVDRVTVDVEELLLDTPTEGNSLQQDGAVYYRVDVEAGQSLLINFDSVSDDAFNELYVSHGKTPTRGDFDYSYNEPFAADQEILIPNTEAGTYYILAYGNSVPRGGAGNSYTIEADIIDFAVLDSNYGVGGTAGNRTIEINGNKFDRNVTAYLRDENGVEIAATDYYWVDSTKFYPTFDLTKTTPGNYDVVVKNANGDEEIVNDGLEVIAGGGAQLKTGLDLPEAVARPLHDPAGRFNGQVNWFNDGINDALSPVLEVSSTAPISTDPNNIPTAGFPGEPFPGFDVTYLFGSSFEHYGVIESDGPPGIILPGQGGQIPLYGAIDPNPESIITNVNLFELSDPYPWEDIKDNLQPAGMTDEEFAPIWEQLIAQVGTTWGDYLEMLSRNANLLPEELLEIYSPNDILAQEMWKAQAAIGTSISGSLSTEASDIALGGRTVIAESTTNGEIFTALTFNDGSFVFPDLPADRYEFSVSELLIDSDLPLSVDLTQGQAIDEQIIPVDPGVSLDTTVSSTANNQPIANAIVSILDDEGSVGIGFTNDDGQVVIPGLEPGIYELWVEADGSARTIISEVEVTDQGGESVINLSPESVIRGQISFSDLDRDRYVSVFATRHNDDSTISALESFFDLTNSGSFELSGLPQGIYDLKFISDGYEVETLSDINLDANKELELSNIELTLEENLNSSLNISSNNTNHFDHRRMGIETILSSEEAFWRTGGFLLPIISHGWDHSSLIVEYLTNDYEMTRRDFSDGSPTVETNGLNVLFGKGKSFRYHPTTQNRFDFVFHKAAVKAYKEYKEEYLSDTKSDSCHNSTNQFPVKFYDLREDLKVDESLLSANGIKKEGDPKWEFDETIVGGLGQYGDDYHGLKPDTRKIDGQIKVSVVNNQIKIEQHDFSMKIIDAWDFVPGNTQKHNPFANFFLESFAVLETFHHAYDVELDVSWTDREERTIEIPLSSHSEDCCEGPNCDPPPPPPEEPPEEQCGLICKILRKIGSYDPNDIIGPEGFGEENWINATQPLNYTIRFENDAELATAPAQTVRITQQLDSDLDFRTFRLGDFGFGDFVIEVPENKAYYQERIDATETLGVYVDFFAGVDVQTGEAFWELTAINPETGELPSNVLEGFLPPNVDGTEGQGFVNYTVRAKDDVPTGTVIDAEAEIIFDVNEPIITPPIFNTLDTDVPVSTVAALPENTEATEFLVQWSEVEPDISPSSTEANPGVGIATYTIYVSENHGEYTPWLTDTELTEATFKGETGKTYSFYSVATDYAGNRELFPAEAQATTTIGGDITTSLESYIWTDANANGIQDQGESGLADVTVTLYDTDGNEIAATTTDSNGLYNFTEIPLGDYALEVTAPDSYIFSPQNLGDDDTIDSDINPDNGRTDIFTLNEDSDLNFDAGLYQYGSLHGTIFNDLNGDGSLNEGETTLENWTVYLDINSNGELDEDEPSKVTNENGNYSFNNLRPDTYNVSQIVQEGWQQTYPVVEISTTASSIKLHTPSEPNVPTTSSNTTTAGELINLDDFRNDERFAEIDGDGYASVIIDTGIDIDHPFFGADSNGDGVSDKIVYQYDFADNDNDASDVDGHGSHVASIIGSSDSTYTGIAPKADLIALKVFKDNGNGFFADLEESLQWVYENAETYNVVSVNLSLGDEQNWDNSNPRYGIDDELAALASIGVIVTAAAGNNYIGIPGVAYPAADSNTIAVGAVDSKTDQISGFSQRHGNLTNVFAPGVPILGANAEGETKSLGGTSQAAPHIAGIAILAQQLAVEQLGRKLTVAEFDSLLATTGVIINDGDDETDDVANTGLDFPRVDTLALAEGILTLEREVSSPAPETPEDNSTNNPLYLPTDSLTNSHTVNLASGETVNDLDFGNQVVEITSENTPPTLAQALADIKVIEDNEFNLTISETTFNDLDAEDSLTYTATLENGNELPPWLTFNTATRTFNGIPSNQDVGVLTIEVTATDNVGQSVSDIFLLTVENEDELPVVSNEIPDITVDEDSENTVIDLSNVFNDIDNNNSAIVKTVLTNSNKQLVTASIDEDNLTLNYQDNQSGTAEITIQGESNGETVIESFSVKVNPIDDSPVVSNEIADVVVDEDADNTVIDLSKVFSDIDNDNSAIVKGISFNSNSGLVITNIEGNNLILDYQDNQSGIAEITVRGTSNGQIVEDTFTITVEEIVSTGEFLVGSEEADELNGTAANDSIFGKDGDDSISGGEGDDFLVGLKDNDLIKGENGNDDLVGYYGDDSISGGAGDDLLLGNRGNDTLDGGTGNDTLVGGMGEDVFVIELRQGQDLIKDFVDGMDLVGLGRGLTFDNLTIVGDEDTQIIDNDDHTIAVLSGVSVNEITKDDFITL